MRVPSSILIVSPSVTEKFLDYDGEDTEADGKLKLALSAICLAMDEIRTTTITAAMIKNFCSR